MKNAIKIGLFIPVLSGLLLASCTDTSGKLEIAGKVIDEFTGKSLPSRGIIVQGLLRNGDETVEVEAGQFITDSTGNFSYKLTKIPDARYYNFCFVGDSDYVFTVKRLGLMEMERNSKYLSFSLSKLADLTIIISRKSTAPRYDTLALYWESDGTYHWKLYPYEITNYSKTGRPSGLNPGPELRWIGGYVNSEVRTRVFAGKMTKLHWDLDRFGKRIVLTDTIRCKRDIQNYLYFTY